MALKRTPLYEAHRALGARLVDFGGWEMPVQYTSILEEHRATRQRAGLFDVSHMGEARITGEGAAAFVNRLVCNDISALPIGKAMYSPMLNAQGSVVDDLLVYRTGEAEFMLVINAGNIEKDIAWMRTSLDAWDAAQGAVTLEDESQTWGQIAIQGPLAQDITQTLTSMTLSDIGFFAFARGDIAGIASLISRTGYTGEDGFEIYCAAENTRELWDALLTVGKAEGLLPVGLGARDTLRFEAALPLYGHELADDISPLEAGLKPFVKLEKACFTGLNALKQETERGPARKLIGLELIEKGVPRSGYRIERNGIDIGFVTSGTFSPTFEKGLAMALVSTDANAAPDDMLEMVVREKRVAARVVKLPFYRRKKASAKT